MNNDGWISIHEQLPEQNPDNPANSKRLMWCDADSGLPDYAQHVGTFWFADGKRNPGMFDGGSGYCEYVFDPNTGKARDLYWKYLGPLPKSVKR
jgi:hypothetical protein